MSMTTSTLFRFAIAPLLLAGFLADSAGAAQAGDEDQVRQVLARYVGLYQKTTLAEWRTLFLPGFVAAFTNDDGSVTTRTLAEFYDRQAKYFATGRDIREELQNIRVTIDGQLASAHADFVLFDNGTESRGKLMLTFIRDREAWKIHSLAFTYRLDPPATPK